MRPSKIVLSPLVLDTFLFWHQFRFMLMIGFGSLISRVVNFCSFSNEISTFSYRHRSASFAPTPSIVNGEVERRSLQERSRSKSVAVRNVFRALSWFDYSSYFLMFEICYVFHHCLPPCPPEHAVRNIWRASSLPSIPPLGRPSGHLGRQAQPGIPVDPAPPVFWPPRAATESPARPSGACP